MRAVWLFAVIVAMLILVAGIFVMTQELWEVKPPDVVTNTTPTINVTPPDANDTPEQPDIEEISSFSTSYRFSTSAYAGSKWTVSVEVENTGETSLNNVVLTAQSAAFANETYTVPSIDSGSTVAVALEPTVTFEVGDYPVKVFVWSDEMIPRSKELSFKVKESAKSSGFAVTASFTTRVGRNSSWKMDVIVKNAGQTTLHNTVASLSGDWIETVSANYDAIEVGGQSQEIINLVIPAGAEVGLHALTLYVDCDETPPQSQDYTIEVIN